MGLSATGVSKSFGATQALLGVDFSVEAGEVHALVGENGSGKSTLMRILHGELRADAGSITVDGRVFQPKNPLEAMRDGVTLIHQELAVLPHLTVAENIFLGAELAHRGFTQRGPMMETAAQLLDQLGRSDLNPNMLAGRLSVSQRQVVEVARALRGNPRVVLFDEPTSSLSHADVEALFSVIGQLRERGIAVVYISHFLDEVMRIADRATVIRDGKIVGTVVTSSTSPAELASLMTGRSILDLEQPTDRVIGKVVLRADSVRTHRLPNPVSIELRKGEILGIAGLQGAGRTELVRALFGLDRLSHGVVSVGASQAQPDPFRNWRARFGFVSEDRKGEGLALQLSIADNLTLTEPGRFWTSSRLARDRTQRVIDRLQVKCAGPDQKSGALSGGNQQKIAIGRLLDLDCDILILDEPTRGIDIGSKAEIFSLMRNLAATGKSILFISSQLSELIGICDRIGVMRRSEWVAEFPAQGLTEGKLLEVCASA